MALDQPQVHGIPPAHPEPSCRFKVRIRFKKGGDLRFLSHHDLMHCFERMLRRGNLPVKASQGFHPLPRMAFALSLALGIVGDAEVLELELEQPLSEEEIHKRLAQQAPAGLEILSVQKIDPKTRAQVRRAFYRVPIPVERREDLPGRIADVLAAPACWVERIRPQPRRIDVRPFLDDLRLEDGFLQIVIQVTPTGSARPDDFIHMLGLADLLDAGAVVERTHLELHDEVPFNPDGKTNVTGPSINAAQGPESRARREPASRPTSLLPGPLSFDS
jgi:radical SAM-linked protein